MKENKESETCDHNIMVSNEDNEFAWKCAICGYIYGK